MTNSELRLRVAAPAASLLFAASLGLAPVAATAVPNQHLPFTPPASWTSLSGPLLPSVALTWTKDETETFGISQLQSAYGLPLPTFSKLFVARMATYGKVVSSGAYRACGHPAQRFVIDQTTGKRLTEQLENVDGSIAVLVYSRPKGSPADPGVMRVLSHYCGASSLAALVPPPGWIDRITRILGIYASPTGQSLLAVSVDPQPGTLDTIAKSIARRVVPQGTSTSVRYVATTTGSLCGNPAFFFTAIVKSATMPAGIEVRVEYTQSATIAESLVYSRLVGTAVDPAALAALASLCASPPGPGATALPAATTVPSAAPTAPLTTEGSMATPPAIINPSATASTAATSTPAPLAPTPTPLAPTPLPTR